VAGHRAADRDRSRRQIRLHGRVGADDQVVISDFDRPLDVPINRQVLFADNASLDAQRAPNPRGDASLVYRDRGVVGHPASSCVPSYRAFRPEGQVCHETLLMSVAGIMADLLAWRPTAGPRAPTTMASGSTNISRPRTVSARARKPPRRSRAA